MGDTVGDPFKDTSGPSLNILIKLMSMVSLVVSPFLYKNNPTATEWSSPLSIAYGVIILVLLIPAYFITSNRVNAFYDNLQAELWAEEKKGDIVLNRVEDEHVLNV